MRRYPAAFGLLSLMLDGLPFEFDDAPPLPIVGSIGVGRLAHRRRRGRVVGVRDRKR